jgi:hypothetical protein
MNSNSGELKSHENHTREVTNPRGHKEDLSLLSHPKSQYKHHKNSEYFDLSHELENKTLEKKGGIREWERGEGDRAPSSYLIGLLHNSIFAPEYN